MAIPFLIPPSADDNYRTLDQLLQELFHILGIVLGQRVAEPHLADAATITAAAVYANAIRAGNLGRRGMGAAVDINHNHIRSHTPGPARVGSFSSHPDANAMAGSAGGSTPGAGGAGTVVPRPTTSRRSHHRRRSSSSSQRRLPKKRRMARAAAAPCRNDWSRMGEELRRIADEILASVQAMEEESEDLDTKQKMDQQDEEEEEEEDDTKSQGQPGQQLLPGCSPCDRCGGCRVDSPMRSFWSVDGLFPLLLLYLSPAFHSQPLWALLILLFGIKLAQAVLR